MTLTVLRHALSVRREPDHVFDALYADQDTPLWFDHHGERGTQVSYLAAGRMLPVTADQWRDQVRSAHTSLTVATGVSVGGAPLGVLLVIPYELAAETLDLPLSGVHTPRALIVAEVIEANHLTGELSLIALVPEGADLGPRAQEIERILTESTPRERSPLPQRPGHIWRDSRARYVEMIERAQSAIANGDAYQVCVTTQVSLPCATDPVALHHVMRRVNPTHHQALIGLGNITLVSASPETFLTVDTAGEVSTRPIKGTRPRGNTADDDERLKRELMESEKERAENLMIVDLMRNDLSKVCEVGSVRVPELLVVESYASVHQLVSTVSGQIKEGCDFLDVLDATFPAGSMTGAPKRSSVELLAGLESGPRDWYSGCFGVWRADGSAEVAMTIRTAVVGPDGITVGVGGGITALSDPYFEISEVGVKALPFLSAFGEDRVQYS